MEVWPAGLFPDRWVGDTAKDALLTHASNSGPQSISLGAALLAYPFHSQCHCGEQVQRGVRGLKEAL